MKSKGLDENDLLMYHLYNASKNPRLRRNRVVAQITIVFSCLALAVIFYDSKIYYLSIYFLIFSIITLLFYPLYTRRQYKKHYQQVVRDTYKNQLGREMQMEITDETISVRDNTMNSTFSTSDIAEINEIRDYYFIKMKSSPLGLIISKSKEEKLEEVEKKRYNRLLRIRISGTTWSWIVEVVNFL